MKTPVTRDNYFDAAAGLYWYCVDYHSGQFSDLYRISCTLDYHPSPMERSPGDSDAREFYAELEAGAWDPSDLEDAISVAMNSCPFGRSHESGPCSACSDS